MALPDFRNRYTSVSLYSRYSFKLTFCTCCTKKCCVAQKSILCQQINISHRSYVAHQNYVSHKKLCCGNKGNCVIPKKEAHVN